MSLRRRIAKAEKALANRKKQQELANCVCGGVVTAIPGQAEEFEAEINRTCPAHGYRRIGHLIRVQWVDSERNLARTSERKRERDRQDDADIDRLIEIYEARFSNNSNDPSQLIRDGVEALGDSEKP